VKKDATSKQDRSKSVLKLAPDYFYNNYDEKKPFCESELANSNYFKLRYTTCIKNSVKSSL